MPLFPPFLKVRANEKNNYSSSPLVSLAKVTLLQSLSVSLFQIASSGRRS